MATLDRHSRLVAWLKIALPMLALAILSTLFLVSHRIDPAQTIPYAEVDVEGLAREQRVGSPSYAGMTADGATVSFMADSARPALDGGRMTAVKPRARIDLPTGRSITVAAAEGYLDRKDNQAGLSGGTVVTTSDGYRVKTDSATAWLDRTRLETAGAVQGRGPMGELTAGRMVLSQDDGGSYLLRFEGGVKLIYRPQP